MPSVGVIVVTYDNESDIPRLAESLSRIASPGSVDFCFVDNASSDDTLGVLFRETKRYGIPAIIHSEGKNTGYAGGVNIGHALLSEKKEYDYFAVLNPDTTVETDWLVNLIRPFSEEKNIGTVSSRLMLPDGTVNALGCDLHWFGFGCMNGYKSETWPTHDSETIYPSGASFAVSRSSLERMCALSGDKRIFWDALFLYHEDADVGVRAKLAGLKNIVAWDSVATHDHVFEATDRNSKKFWYQERNRALVMMSCYKVPTLILLFPCIVLFEFLIWIIPAPINMRTGRGSMLKSLFGMLGTRGFWKRRARIQKNRVISDGILWKSLTPRIEHQETDNGLVRYIVNPIFSVIHFVYGIIIFW